MFFTYSGSFVGVLWGRNSLFIKFSTNYARLKLQKKEKTFQIRLDFRPNFDLRFLQ